MTNEERLAGIVSTPEIEWLIAQVREWRQRAESAESALHGVSDTTALVIESREELRGELTASRAEAAMLRVEFARLYRLVTRLLAEPSDRDTSMLIEAATLIETVSANEPSTWLAERIAEARQQGAAEMREADTRRLDYAEEWLNEVSIYRDIKRGTRCEMDICTPNGCTEEITAPTIRQAIDSAIRALPLLADNPKEAR